MNAMTIGNAAERAGVGVETIRFYERQGLIERPPTPLRGGYRVYPQGTVRRVRFIRRAQQLGFALREIADLLSLRTTAGADASDVRRRAIAKLRDVDEKIDRLCRIREGLADLLDSCPGEGALRCCSILEALEDDEVLTGATPDRGVGAPGRRHQNRPLLGSPTPRGGGRSGHVELPEIRAKPTDWGPAEVTAPPKESVMQTVKLRIEGMHCGGCTEIVRHVLEQEPGVQGCSVSHEQGLARVAVDPARVSGNRLAEVVCAAGYEATVLTE